MSTGDFDPYQQPPGYGGPPAGQPGTLGIRFLARLLDGIVVGFLASILTSLFGFGSDTVLGVPSYTLTAGLFSGVLMFAYFVGFETWKGWTPAKNCSASRCAVSAAPRSRTFDSRPCATCSLCWR